MTIATDFIANLGRMLQLGGTDGSLIYADAPNDDPVPVRFLLNHPLSRDEAIVNAYGVNALVLTIPATAALLPKPPKKFDLIVFDLNQGAGATPYALDSVKLHQLLNTPVAWTAYVKGKTE